MMKQIRKKGVGFYGITCSYIKPQPKVMTMTILGLILTTNVMSVRVNLEK